MLDVHRWHIVQRVNQSTSVIYKNKFPKYTEYFSNNNLENVNPSNSLTEDNFEPR